MNALDNDDFAQLVRRAQKGDRAAFDSLTAAHAPRARAIVKHMIGHPDDTDEVMQEALVRAWRSIGEFRLEAAFSTWLTSIASRCAIDFLRGQKRWRAAAQVAYANLCAGSEELSGEVVSRFSDPDFAYEVREHIAYCFSCVGRSLPPDEIAALVLRDIAGLSAREASDVLGVTDSVLRHRLAAARKSMQDQYDGLCALVNKQGICHQCRGLQMIAADDRKGGPFPDISTLADRCAVVRECRTMSMRNLHDLFWRRTKKIEEKGLGSTTPDSGCGETDEDDSS